MGAAFKERRKVHDSFWKGSNWQAGSGAGKTGKRVAGRAYCAIDHGPGGGGGGRGGRRGGGLGLGG